MEFESSPLPERIELLNFLSPTEPLPKLTVGVVTRTHDNSGLRLVGPVKEIGFAVGLTNGGDKEMSVSINASMARAVAASIIKFCNEIEHKDN